MMRSLVAALQRVTFYVAGYWFIVHLSTFVSGTLWTYALWEAAFLLTVILLAVGVVYSAFYSLGYGKLAILFLLWDIEPKRVKYASLALMAYLAVYIYYAMNSAVPEMHAGLTPRSEGGRFNVYSMQMVSAFFSGLSFLLAEQYYLALRKLSAG